MTGPKDDADNHSAQMNPNSDTYWTDRGEDGRPDGWRERPENDD